jgi:hypothetical protein
MSKTKSIALILGVLVMSFLVGYLIFAWTEPSQAPPGGNVAEPLNRSSNPQDKPARLTFTEFYDYNNTNYYVNPDGLSVLAGPVGIGTNTPDTNYKLDVNGGITIPYKKSSSPWPGDNTLWKADINKDGNIDIYDLRLVSEAYGCTSAAGCWNAIIAVDNLGNYIKKSDTDINSDGVIDIIDVSTVSSKLKYPTANIKGDINRDNVIDYIDLSYVVRAYGCNYSAPPDCGWDHLGLDNFGNYIDKRNTDVDGNGKIDVQDVAYVASHYYPTYYIETYGFGAMPAARFFGVDNSSSNYTLMTYNSSNNPLLSVRNDGNIGIGTNSPVQKLDVVGGYVRSDTGFCIGGSCITNWSAGGGIGGSGTQNYIAKFTDAAGVTIGNSLIYDNGTNVGIGTTSPGAILHVYNNADVTNQANVLKLEGIRSSGALRGIYLTVSNTSGSVSKYAFSGTASGAGTNYGFQALSENGTTDYGVYAFASGGSIDYAIYAKAPDGTANDYGLYVDSGKTYFGGNVGIGTTSPASGYKLDVEGKIQANSFDVGDITFRDQKTNKILWRMFEDENGLYLENSKTGKIYRFLLEEIKK